MLTALAIFLLSSAWIVQADHWGYQPELPNGVVSKGNEGWGGQCSQGRRQSPIDLVEEASIIGKYAPLKFDNYDEVLKSVKVRNTGHSLQIDVSDGQEYFMSGGGLPGVYVMDQMHFHWSSEHTINGRRNGLELHIVSHNKMYQNFSTAVQNKRGVAVLGVFYHVGGEHNRMLKNILDSAEPIKDDVGESNLIKNPFAPIELLPARQTPYFRYDGSLTTPTCDEAVIWTILKDSVPFAMSQIERFKSIKDEHGKYLTHNFRQLQRLNARPLVYATDDEYFTSSGSAISTALMILCPATVFQMALQWF